MEKTNEMRLAVSAASPLPLGSYISPRGGIYADARPIQGGPRSNHNIPASDQKLVVLGIYNLHQLVHCMLTGGEILPWFLTDEGRLLSRTWIRWS